MTVVNSTTGLNDTEYSLSDNKGMLKYDKAALDDCCDIINSHDTLTAKVAELEAALKTLLDASIDYKEYKHDGDPDNEDARVMGEMELNDLDNNGTIESIKKLLEAES